jgi:hypothetical protein
MKKIILVTLIFLSSANLLQAQLKESLKKVMELKMPKTVDDEMPGTRGASVVWHPVQKKYYAVFAGNAGFPLAVFDATGKRISDADLTAMKDTRGLWYNPATKKINGNGYAKTGWFTYVLNKIGIPDSAKTIFEGLNQPDSQCVGAFHPVRKEVMFLYNGIVSLYALADGSTSASVQINWGRKKAEGKPEDEITETPPDYNNSTVIYTGIKNAELGFLNKEKNKIELYDFMTGFLTTQLPLPKDAVTEGAFNFAYTNGIYWLFNIAERKWVGYK